MPADSKTAPSKADTAAAEAQALFQQAVNAYRQRQLPQAEALARNVLKKQPRHVDALNFLSVIAYQSGKFSKAAELLDKAIRIAPQVPDFHTNRGHAFVQLGQPADAIGSYDRAIALRPDYPDAYYNRGIALQRLGRHEEAIASYDQALSQQPEFPQAHYNRGNALTTLKKFDEAIESYDRAIALRPLYVEALNNRGIVLQKLKRHEDAVESFERASRAYPEGADAYYNKANALQDLKRYEDAIASYDKALSIRPTFADGHYSRGNALAELKRMDEAAASYNTALALDPEHLDTRKTLLRHAVVESADFSAIAAMSRETAQIHLRHEIADLEARKSISAFRARHDLEQTDYLIAHGYSDDGLKETNRRLRDGLERHQKNAGAGDVPRDMRLFDREIADVARFRRQLLRYDVPADIGACLNPDNDWAAIEDQYFSSTPETISIDNFLAPRALAEMRTFCLVSAVWKTEYQNQYLGAVAETGFISPLHLQLARELREKMPRIFGNHALEQLWAFKYDPKVASGINVHADFARVNLNFWITPDEANLDPESGGLIVYDVPAPSSWSFEQYNIDQARIYEFLAQNNAGKKRIPYRCNRAVLFNSTLFHETDATHFKEGYENRRINITYLFGVGLQ